MATYTGQTITGSSIIFSADDTYVNCTLWGFGTVNGTLNMDGGTLSSSYISGLFLVATNGAKVRGCWGYFPGYIDDGTVEVSGTWFNTVGYLQMASPQASRKFMGGVFTPGGPFDPPLALPGSPFRRRESVMNSETFSGTTKWHDGKYQFTYKFKMNETPTASVTVYSLPTGANSTLEIYRDNSPTRLAFISGSLGTLTLTLPTGENYQSIRHNLIVITPTEHPFSFVFGSSAPYQLTLDADTLMAYDFTAATNGSDSVVDASGNSRVLEIRDQNSMVNGNSSTIGLVSNLYKDSTGWHTYNSSVERYGVQQSDFSSLISGYSLTLEIRFKINSWSVGGSTESVLLGVLGEELFNTQGMELGILPSTQQLRVIIKDGGGTWREIRTSPSLGEFITLKGVLDISNSMLYLYKNGTLVGSSGMTSLPTFNSDYYLTVGRRAYQWTGDNSVTDTVISHVCVSRVARF